MSPMYVPRSASSSHLMLGYIIQPINSKKMRTVKLFLVSGILLISFTNCTNETIPEVDETLQEVSAKVMVDAQSLVSPSEGLIEVGTSYLKRNGNGLTAKVVCDGLIPGHTYTLWWVIWNNPGECNDGAGGPCGLPDFAKADLVQVELLYASGVVAGKSGKATFSAHLKEGDNDGSVNDLFELPSYGGLQEGNKMGAEVHMVIRSHGPGIPGEIGKQITTYLGGCDPEAGLGFEPFTQIPMNPGECGDIFAAIHLPVSE